MEQLEEHLDKLPVFFETVRQGSIRSAAKTLGRSQPAVSRIIRVLEEAVGTRLFVRGQEGVTLTPMGERLFEFADRMRAQLRDLAGGGEEKQIRQQVCLGSYDSIAIYFFPPFLKYAEAHEEGLEITLYTERSPTLVDSLLRSQVDIIISVNPPARHNIVSTLLYTDEYRVYRRPDLVATVRSPVITVPAATDQEGRSVGTHLTSSVYARRRRFLSQSFELVSALTVAGLGLGIAPTRVAAKAVDRGDLVEHIPEDGPPWRFGLHRICVSYLSHRVGDPGIEWIHRTLHEFESTKML